MSLWLLQSYPLLGVEGKLWLQAPFSKQNSYVPALSQAKSFSGCLP